jgi:hypothetical protein
MIAVDTQILVYSHRTELAEHSQALAKMKELVARRERWAIPMHCLVEFYANVTSRKFKVPSTPEQAMGQTSAWLASPECVVLTEDAKTWLITRDLVLRAWTRGKHTYDARIAAVCLQHGVSELWTNDRDFFDFPDLRVRNPLVDEPTRASEAKAAYAPRARTAKPVAVVSPKRIPSEYPRAGTRTRASTAAQTRR